MIRGKYLRERKAIRVKRRIKLLLAIVILFIAHKILFNSYSLYESEASSTADINVAFYTLEDEYETKVISLDEMLPGSTRTVKFSISNFYVDENNEKVTTETDMEYELKIRTTTNLPLEYKLYKEQSLDSDELIDMLEVETVENANMYLDEDKTIFKALVQSDPDLKAEKITDKDEFSYKTSDTKTYILEVKLPENCNTVDYQNIIECIEISVDSKQIIEEEAVGASEEII